MLFLVITIVPLALLGLVFWKIHSMTKKYVGLFSNRKLIFWHFTFFFTAMALFTFKDILLSDAGGDKEAKYSRIGIAGCSF